jgi:tetratricopeptide (TPR) repeat protein
MCNIEKMDINTEIQLALKHYQAGNLKQAENVLINIVEFQSNNITAINLLGIISYQLKDYDSVIQYMTKLISLTPDNAQAYYILGHSMQEKGQIDEALTYYQKTLQLNPNFADVYYNLGTIFQDKKRYDEAIFCYQKALQFNPNDVDAIFNTAVSLQEKRHFEEAINVYKKLLQLNLNLDEEYGRIGLSIQEMGRSEEAISFYKKANQLNPNNLIALYGLARCAPVNISYPAKTNMKVSLNKAIDGDFFVTLREKLDNTDCRIVCFGSSVTQQKKGYAPNLFRCFEEHYKMRRHSFLQVGYGGCNLKDAGIIFLPDVVAVKPDVCFLDWHTGFILLDEAELIAILEYMIETLLAIKCLPVFLFVYCTHSYNRRRQMRHLTEKILRAYGIPSINARNCSVDQNIHALLRDDVHLTDEGGRVFGECFFRQFLALLASPIQADTSTTICFPQDNKYFSFQTLDIGPGMIKGDFRKEGDYFILDSSNELFFELKGEILGFHMLIGPYSPIVSVEETDNAGQILNTTLHPLWDEFCHYERFSINIIYTSVCIDRYRGIRILITENAIDYSKCRRKYDFSKIGKLLKLSKVSIIGELLY